MDFTVAMYKNFNPFFFSFPFWANTEQELIKKGCFLVGCTHEANRLALWFNNAAARLLIDRFGAASLAVFTLKDGQIVSDGLVCRPTRW